jgi:hypothetical protein
MKKLLIFLKKVFPIFTGVSLAFTVWLILTLKSVEFHYANRVDSNPTLICRESRSWGIFSNDDLTCFGLVQIVKDNTPTLTPTPALINGELKLSK